MNRVLISACLLGVRVRYDGRSMDLDHPVLHRWHQEGRLVAVCPEMAGGLPVPRAPAEIRGDDGGEAVWKGTATVVTRQGVDVTPMFKQGALQTLATARMTRVIAAILTERSPSCGSTVLYDGSFSGRRRSGRGVTAQLLAASGIRVFSQNDITAAERWIAALEGTG